MDSNYYHLLIYSSVTLNITIGIDQYSFQVQSGQPFYGIKNIPTSGIHSIHFQVAESIEKDDNSSLIYGYWFDSKEVLNRSLYLRYNESSELFQIVEESNLAVYHERVKEYSHLMVTYPQISDIENEGNWFQLTECMSWDDISKICKSPFPYSTYFAYADSSMTTKEEMDLLHKKLYISSTESKFNENYFQYTEIKFKSVEAIREGFKMQDFMDKSYYLNEVILKKNFKGIVTKLLGELQFAYLNAMKYGNYGSSMQWHSIIELITQSSQISNYNQDQTKQFFAKLDVILSTELKALPEPYVDILLSESVWKRCISSSLHGEALNLTKNILKEMILGIFANEDVTGFEEDYDGEDADSNSITEYGDQDERLGVYYPNIEGDEEDDEFQPTVVGGVYHNAL